MNTRDRIKRAWAWYQQQMFAFQVAWTEINKPLAPLRDAATFTIMLELAGIKFNLIEWGISYVVISVVLIAFGQFLIYNGVQKFNNFLGNQQNEMMLKIDDLVEYIKNER